MNARYPALRLMTLIVLHASAVQAAEEVEIKFAHPVPSGTLWDKALEEMGAEWLQSSQGQVRIKIYPRGVAGPDDTVIRKLQLGQLHAASLSYVGLTRLDDAFEVFTIPLFFDSYEEFFYVIDKMEPVLKQRLDAKGLVLLSWGLGGWTYLFSRSPIEELEDLKRMDLFTAAGDAKMVQIYKRNGYSPVALDTTDIPSGLQTGMFDALPTTPLLALAFQFYRSTKNMNDFGLAPVIGATVITKSAWKRIPEQHRAAILESAKRAETRLREEIPGQEKAAVEQMKRRGLKVTSSRDLENWRREADRFCESLRGTVVPTEIFDQALAERNAYRRGLGTVKMVADR